MPEELAVSDVPFTHDPWVATRDRYDAMPYRRVGLDFYNRLVDELLAAERANARRSSLEERDQVVRLTLPSNLPDDGSTTGRRADAVNLHTQKYALDDFESAINDLDAGNVRGRAILTP